MLFDWRGRPALMFPTLAFVVERPGAAWTRCNASQVAAEAEPLGDDEFWDRFGDWSLSQFPIQFSALDKGSSNRKPPPPRAEPPPVQAQQQQQPQEPSKPKDTEPRER
jgi:hypothetical protein